MNNQKKWELLKHAYDNYPKGTRIYSTSQNGQISELIGEYRINDYGSIEDISSWLVFNSGIGKWAEKVDKKPLLISEDGFELFEGDYYVCVKNLHGNGWEICFEQTLGASHFVITDSEICKALSTKESAEKWIEENNKPKEIEVKLFANGDFAKVSEKEIKIINPFTSLYLKPSDIEDIHNALKTLSK